MRMPAVPHGTVDSCVLRAAVSQGSPRCVFAPTALCPTTSLGTAFPRLQPGHMAALFARCLQLGWPVFEAINTPPLTAPSPFLCLPAAGAASLWRSSTNHQLGRSSRSTP